MSLQYGTKQQRCRHARTVVFCFVLFVACDWVPTASECLSAMTRKTSDWLEPAYDTRYEPMIKTADSAVGTQGHRSFFLFDFFVVACDWVPTECFLPNTTQCNAYFEVHAIDNTMRLSPVVFFVPVYLYLHYSYIYILHSISGNLFRGG